MSTDLDDALLPAAAHLTDDRARDVVAAAVRAGGGDLHTLDPTQVLYRPGRELVVQYTAMVSWQRAPVTRETLLAGTTTSGAPAGTMVLQADDALPGGTSLEIGVWRYPFDPALDGLQHGVMAASVAELLGLDHPPDLTVVSYRPCRRAVVRATWPTGQAFVKIVPPAQVTSLVTRHLRSLAAGLPVPEVVAVDADRGLVALRALPGVDLRTHLLVVDGASPDGAALIDLVGRVATVDLAGLDAEARPSLTAAAPRHAAMLATVLPDARGCLDDLVETIGRDRPGPMSAIHGDLHEAQVRIADGRIVGLLDVDDLGPGDPLDDLARMLGHLIALSFVAGPAAGRVRSYADQLHHHIGTRVDRCELDRRVGAALVGLATGPFRSQSDDWQRETRRLLDEAASWLTVDSNRR